MTIRARRLALRIHRVTAVAALVALLMAIAAPLSAQTLKYVTDALFLRVRDLPRDDAQTIAQVESGDRIFATGVLEQSYAQIRLGDGTQGWVQSSFLTDAPPARQQLERLRSELQESKLTQAQFEQELRASKFANEDLGKALGMAEAANTKLQSLVDAAREREQAGFIPESAHRKVKQNADRLKEENRLLRIKLRDESTHTAQLWFIIGGGAIVLGIALGAGLVRLGRKRSGWPR